MVSHRQLRGNQLAVMSGKSSDKFYKTVVFAEDMTDTMLEKVLATARDAFQLQVTVRSTRSMDSWS